MPGATPQAHQRWVRRPLTPRPLGVGRYAVFGALFRTRFYVNAVWKTSSTPLRLQRDLSAVFLADWSLAWQTGLRNLAQHAHAQPTQSGKVAHSNYTFSHCKVATQRARCVALQLKIFSAPCNPFHFVTIPLITRYNSMQNVCTIIPQTSGELYPDLCTQNLEFMYTSWVPHTASCFLLIAICWAPCESSWATQYPYPALTH